LKGFGLPANAPLTVPNCKPTTTPMVTATIKVR
jgi:hypothetical protein